MADADAFDRTPLALIIEDDHETVLALDALLGGAGYALLKAASGKQGLDLLSKVQPDLLIVGVTLPDLSGMDVLRSLRRVPHVRSSTPVIMIAPSPLDARRRVDAFEAGAWDIMVPPFEPKEVVPRLRSFVAAKQDADHARDEGLLDPTTGFYNIRGVLRRVSELTADAARYQRPMACVVIGADPGTAPDAHAAERLSQTLALTLTSTTRLSDTIGRLGELDFVVVAAGTNTDGASRLAERLLQRVEGGADDAEPLPTVRAGYYAVSNSGGDPVIPVDLLTRATLALRKAQDEANGVRIFNYEPT